MGWQEEQHYLVVLLSLSIHLHSSAQVPSMHMHCPTSAQEGLLAQNNQDLKQQLKHLNKNMKQKKRRGAEEKKCSGINPSVALAAQSPWQVPAVSKEL